jgi:hypothetical protein
LVYFFLSVSPLYGQSPVQILSECESLSGWGSSANLVRDAKQGQFAIAADLPADRTGFLTFNYFQTGIDISNSYALSFWWKAEGLADFKIKVRNYPLVGGMEAVYTIWSGTAPPDGWQQTTVVLSKPQFDSWGGEPDQTRRYVTFRTVPSPNTDVRLVLDQIVVVSETFEWQVGLPAQTVVAPTVDFDGDGKIAFSDFLLFVSAYGTSKGDDSYQDRFDLDADQQIRFSDFIIFAQGFGSDGKQWHVPITVQNLTADSLSIGLGSGNHPLSALLVPGNSQSVLEIPLSIGLTAPQDPTEAYPIPL